MSQNGVLGEQYAANYLKLQGYRIVDMNFRTRFGEIDIIAQKEVILAFVEVKTRSLNTLARPAQAVNTSKQRKIITAAMIYLEQHPNELQPRFDVIEIITATKNEFRVVDIEHLTGAFEVGQK